MGIPITRFFRILVVGEEYANVCRTIEEELHFTVTQVPSGGFAEAIRAGADLGAIVVSRADVADAIAQRDARGLRMPVQTILELLASGMTFDEAMATFHQLERDGLITLRR